MMYTQPKLIQLLLIVLMLTSPFCYAKEVLTIVGSTTVTPIVKASEASFKSHSNIGLIIRPKGSSAGIAAVAKGEADIGMASRPLKQSEKKEWPQLKEITLAEDAIVLLVSSKNPTTNLTKQQVTEIYSCKYSNWPEVDKSLNYDSLRSQKISLISKKEGHGSLSAFIDLFDLSKPKVTGRKMYFKSKDGSEFSRIGSSQVDTAKQAMTLVARITNSLGYESLGAIENLKKDSLYSQIKILKIDGVEPSIASVSTGQYKIKRPLLLVVDKNKTNPQVAEYLKYMSSPEGKNHVTSLGYIAKD
ncbi:substrate-binding domain-containing protein [Spartinivicinus ruber]|uniref:substrate-binding domain-containing protein n=1 Tax=Spartinivicinus ruber TaxID=2683272 RepID=UPI0013D73BA1|nr:substrate-binding domain-containing protein [Spartinivicinus ruber]